MGKIKYIFIDIDNTLLDFDACVHEALYTGFKKFQLGEFNEDMFETFTNVNNAMWKRLENGEIDLAQLKKERFAAVFDALSIDFDGVTFEKWFRIFVHECVIPVDGAYELLDSLSSRFILCTASNGPEEQQRHRMALSKMDKYFKYHFISEGLGVSKPSKQFFEKAMNVMGNVKPNECLIIGDSLTSDIQGGINAGMKTVYFNKHKKKENKQIKPDYEFDSLKEIADFLIELELG